MNSTTQISRRHFLGGLLGAAAALHADPLGLPIGCQTYPVRDALGKDFDGTLKELAGIGFRAIEMCSPAGYKGAYAPLIAIKPSEMKARIHAAGLACESCHFQLREFKESLDERIAFSKELGLKQMVVSSFAMPRNATLADWARVAGEVNPLAERVHKAGMQAAFHNHNVEFTQLDGSLIYDKLLSEFDPKLVKMQFQTYVVSMGVDAPAVLAKHPGRFSSLHLQDFSPANKEEIAIGQGAVDWKKLFGAAKKAGVKNYFVEMNMGLMKDSVPYLRSLKV